MTGDADLDFTEFAVGRNVRRFVSEQVLLAEVLFKFGESAGQIRRIPGNESAPARGFAELLQLTLINPVFARVADADGVNDHLGAQRLIHRRRTFLHAGRVITIRKEDDRSAPGLLCQQITARGDDRIVDRSAALSAREWRHGGTVAPSTRRGGAPDLFEPPAQPSRVGSEVLNDRRLAVELDDRPRVVTGPDDGVDEPGAGVRQFGDDRADAVADVHEDREGEWKVGFTPEGENLLRPAVLQHDDIILRQVFEVVVLLVGRAEEDVDKLRPDADFLHVFTLWVPALSLFLPGLLCARHGGPPGRQRG